MVGVPERSSYGAAGVMTPSWVGCGTLSWSRGVAVGRLSPMSLVYGRSHCLF